MVTFVLVLRTTSRSCSVLKITFAPFAQAFSAYNKLDADLKLTLPPPTAQSAMEDLTNCMNLCKDQWFDKYRYVSSRPKTTSDIRTPGFRTQDRDRRALQNADPNSRQECG